ncbi:hypothetical protein NE237_016129 [Protea cynaroides]|uniref:protein-serine/threonine phosphatase n=1 Tax=Protea cynaroides TaxID=273540 RepID=A0A9Q0KF37_9MAGN|nr:hypothetical protein NE237_016129 [Protea cynaroides]
MAIHPSFCRRDSLFPSGLHFFGVYDGHGCSHVAKSCKERMHQLVKEELENRETSTTKWKEAMELSFSRMDKEVSEWSTSVSTTSCGCELRTSQRRSLVIYWDGARVLGVLAMSRAIGDSYLNPYVVSEPEVTITEQTEEDECLILASDGLWDVVSNDTACSIARMCIDGQAPSPPPSPRSDSRSSGGDDDMNVGVTGETSDKSCLKKSVISPLVRVFSS